MKKIITLFVLLFSYTYNSAQDLHCATDRVMLQIYERNPQLRAKKQELDNKTKAQQQKSSSSATYVIPVVFHILHLDGPENISDEQVKDAMRILNRDFARKNPDTTDIIPVFKNLADSTKIQFVLATKDPLGNCTNGIKHYYDPDTDWDENSPTLYSHTWDPTHYMNVYVVRKIIFNSGFGAAGYTYFPGTWPIGDQHDAIVVLNNYFGSIGTGSNFLSRVLTHEVGHWLDLYHVFGSTNAAGVDCSGDDFVNDTPPTPGYLNCPNPANPAQYQICTAGVSENFQNYMDYSYCCRMFTQEQGQRMQLALQNPISGRDILVSTPNLLATGVLNPNGPCVPIADFKYSRTKTCVGTPVTFTDASWNGEATNYSWSFPGGTPSSSTASVVTVVYNQPGTYAVTYVSSNLTGTSSPVTKNNIIQVNTTNAQYQTPWQEGFENLTQINTDWITFSSSGATKWVQTPDPFQPGNDYAKLSATDNTRKNVTTLIGPTVKTSAGPLAFAFSLAAAEITSNHVNNLKAFLSVDCGNTWTMVYNKTGQNLVTSTSTSSNFIPKQIDWRPEAVGLTQQAFANTTVQVKFEYTRDTIPGASNVYLDNINIMPYSSIDEFNEEVLDMQVYPVPSKGELNLTVMVQQKSTWRVSLNDLLGRELEVLESGSDVDAGLQTRTYSLNERYPEGVYFLNVQMSGRSYTRKIILTR